MSTIINATTTNGVVIQPDNSGSLVLQTNNGTTALTIDTSQNITTTNKLASASMPTGTTLQAVQAIFTGTQTLATGGVNANFSDITSLSVTITPSSSSNKILLIAHLTSMCGDDRIIFFKFTGGNTATFVGDAASNKTRVGGFYSSGSLAGSANGAPVTMMYLDSPATTSAITYKVQGAPNYLSGSAYINFNPNESDNAYFPRGASSLIAIEVKG